MRSISRARLIGGLTLFALMLCASVTSRSQSQSQAGNRKMAERSICHITGNVAIPFELITVRQGARASHLGHGDVEAEDGKCPSFLPASWSSGSNDKGKAAGRKQGGTAPNSNSGSNENESTSKFTAFSEEEEKKTAICHREGNGEFHLNTVSSSSVDAHLAHGDMFPEGGSCLDGTTGGDDVEPGATPEPITMLLFGAGLAGVGYMTRRRLSGSSERA